MTDQLPEPLTPAECDLRGMPYMPLDLVTLFDSDLYALSTGDEFKAALTLWGKVFIRCLLAVYHLTNGCWNIFPAQSNGKRFGRWRCAAG